MTEPASPTGSPRRRLLGTGAVVVVLAAAGLGIGYAVASRPDTSAHAATVPTATATVTRGTVTERTDIAGTLGYAGSYTVTDQLAPGVLTWTPRPGGTVRRGRTLYEVGATHVRLLYGRRPAYRAFTAGMTDGPDVRELEANLVALGDDPYHQIAVDDHFDWATRDAIVRWQQAQGLPADERTGELALGTVVFLPGALRVGGLPVALGARARPGGPVLTGTSTRRVVTAQVTTDQQTTIRHGDTVLVTLPDSTTVTGTVTAVARVATGTGSSGDQSGGDQTQTPTVAVTIAVTLPSGTDVLDQATVQVAVTTARHSRVLVVPVTALLARPAGGYQVRVVSGHRSHFVPVTPGLYDDAAGTVEVSGHGLAAGQKVEVPTQ